MPFHDLPCRREDSAPVLNLTDPHEIWRYFEDLDFLFAKHRVSDPQEKKQAAVFYLLSVTEVALWKTAFTFSNPDHPYEEFKAEIIALYPEAEAALQHTLADLDRLVADRARTPICSVKELGEYYRQFLLISRFLIANNRHDACTLMQARHFLAGFGPNLAVDIRTILERKFLDHPYDVQAICDAALDTLIQQRSAPSIQPPRDVPTPSTLTLTTPAPIQPPPPSSREFPLAPQSPPAAQADLTVAQLGALAEAIVTLANNMRTFFSTQTATEFALQGREPHEAKILIASSVEAHNTSRRSARTRRTRPVTGAEEAEDGRNGPPHCKPRKVHTNR